MIAVDPDHAKAVRVLQAVPPDAAWLATLASGGPMRRIPDSLAEAVYRAHEQLERDVIEFVDPELAGAHQRLLEALADLGDEIGGTFPPEGDDLGYTEVPPEWRRTEPDRYYEALRDLSTARQAVLNTYKELMNAMNRRGHLPSSPSPQEPGSGQSVSVTAGDNSPVIVNAPNAHASHGATANASANQPPEASETTATPWWNRSSVLWTALGSVAAVAAAVAGFMALYK